MPALVARMLGETRTTTLQPKALDALPSGLFRTVGAASAVRAAARAVSEPEGQAVAVDQEAGLGRVTLGLLDLGFEEAEEEAGCALEECVVSSQYSRPQVPPLNICCMGLEAALRVSSHITLFYFMHCVWLPCSGLQRGARGRSRCHVAPMLPCVP